MEERSFECASCYKVFPRSQRQVWSYDARTGHSSDSNYSGSGFKTKTLGGGRGPYNTHWSGRSSGRIYYKRVHIQLCRACYEKRKSETFRRYAIPIGIVGSFLALCVAISTLGNAINPYPAKETSQVETVAGEHEAVVITTSTPTEEIGGGPATSSRSNVSTVPTSPSPAQTEHMLEKADPLLPIPANEPLLANAIENALNNGGMVRWHTTDGAGFGYVTPSHITHYIGGELCRSFSYTVTIRTEHRKSVDTEACRSGSGRWAYNVEQ